MLKLAFENMTSVLNIFNLQRQPIVFDEFDSVNWLDLYACDDSYADSLIEDDICEEIDSLPFDSSHSSSITHTFDPILKLKPLPDSLKYVFLSPNDTFPMIIASYFMRTKKLNC